MSPYFTFFRKLTIRSKDFSIYCKPDAHHGAILKITQTNAGAPGGKTVVNKIYATLDVATELCERLNALEQLYRESHPLPRNGRLHFEEIVEQDSTYKLDFSVKEYRQNLEMTQSKKILTRGPCDSINIPDVGEFRRELLQLVEELSNNYLTLKIETADNTGFSKVIRGNRVAVIYCPVRPWPWTRSYPTEVLLFDPILVELILFDRDVKKIREHCDRTYPDLMVDAYVDMNYDHNEWNIFYENLKIRWIRRGQQFRINEHLGTLSLKHEDHWFTA
ncbi:hypothetical protein DAPPUDRAFT_259343 [Daphnia pulex]|uniref:Uncharacterized protein n=2 Tax=Daphnia pulex TaxID=6669 RepID=E9HH44_DAPPU|nr:hypothetical protein DAPPUDRAFT_259343 [Daphnia pulex]|eukprot:EFX68945.1 hypothetical protein DAPPUDRAFT_259343 [Daphnia pulex]